MKEPDNTQDQKTIELLQSLKETPVRDPNQATRGRQAFLAQAKEISSQPVSIPFFQRLIDVFNRPKLQMRFSTLTIGAIFGILLLTFSSSAYAARQSKPDQFLYPFKLWLEESRLSLTQKSEAQIELHLVFAEERLSELSAEGKTYTTSEKDQALRNLTGHLNSVGRMLENEPDDDSQRDRLEILMDRYQEYEQEEQEGQHPDQEEKPDEISPDSEKNQGGNQEDINKESGQSEDQENSEDDINEDKGKHKEDFKDISHSQGADDSSGDDQDPDVESTDEPEDDPTVEPDSSHDDPTKTPEPGDD